MYRRRYMISWKKDETTGRDHWVMERSGKLSPNDIKWLEVDIGKKWGMSGPVIITNYVQIN